ncbi:cytochrome b561 [Entomohabitans teleogrylli]|uniref:cytochrome b561 n=1 Tax=Entomohabitans teleogrylli TaxID=1384589 RepID=UPI00073D68E7|nr:cytochrome b561 [Entomohabitans teleogrylli]
MGNKFAPLQITLHWLVFILIVAAYCAMELRGLAPTGWRPWFNITHITCGLSVLVLMIARLALRLKYRTPEIVPRLSPMMTGLAHLGHTALYLLFIALPLLGFFIQYYRGREWGVFGVAMPFASVADEDLRETLTSWHELLANAGYFVIGLHALAALLHHYYWRDNTLLRMMPGKRGRE